jgi:hypothetical protein
METVVQSARLTLHGKRPVRRNSCGQGYRPGPLHDSLGKMSLEIETVSLAIPVTLLQIASAIPNGLLQFHGSDGIEFAH